MFGFNRLTSRNKLITGFSAIVVFTIILLLISFRSIMNINQNQQKLENWMSLTQEMTHLRAEGHMLRNYMLDAQMYMLENTEIDNLQKLDSITSQILIDFENLYAELGSLEEYSSEIAGIKSRFDRFMENHRQQILMLKQGNADEFKKIATIQYRLFNVLRQDFATMENQMLAKSTILHESSNRILFTSIISSLIAGIVVVLVVILIVVGTFKMLKRIIREMNQAVEVLGTSSAEIETTITEISTGAAETATAISETTATIEEIRQTSLLASQKAKAMMEDASNASEAASHGLNSSEKMVLAISEIEKQMQQINLTIEKLASQSNSIGEITSTVSDIADQSNLLAVNASIEAAKAGSLGKGFGIVAQEIRSLSEQSKKSTAQVKDILEQMREQVLNAVEMIKKGNAAVTSGSKIVLEDKEITNILADNIEATSQASLQISSTSQQQMAGMDQIVPAMNNIKMASEQNVSAMRQVQKASADLNELGRNIQKILNRYKI